MVERVRPWPPPPPSPAQLRARMIACLEACARAGMQTDAMFALNKHVLGDHRTAGAGTEETADTLLAAGFDPPEDPQKFSAALACNMLKIGRPT